MTESERPSGRVGVTARLKEFARNVSRFADKASDEQQRYLFKLLEDAQLVGLLEHWDRRKAPRKQCQILVRYVVEDKVFKDVITDISTDGAFMETMALLATGQHISLIFSPPNQEEPLTVTGKIVRTTEDGVGIQFTAENEDLEKMIDTL
jgi:hypothetical protein